jgi:peptidoglycan/LPS O-acetylase OafA/YrhL
MPETSRNAPKLVSLDILRACAAILVMLKHARTHLFVAFGALPPEQHTIVASAFYLFTRLAREAVLVFFVLSGFLVGGQVIRRMRDGRFNVREYAIDRMARILLPLAPAALFAAIVGTVWHGAPFDLVQVAGNILGLNGVLVDTLPFNGPLWSLAYEIWFYVIAGVVATICARTGGRFSLFISFAAVLVFCRLDAYLILIWLLGALISIIEVPKWRGALAALGLIVLLIGSIILQMSPSSVTLTGEGLASTAVAAGVFAVGFSMTLPWLISASLNHALARWTGVARVFSFLAGMSYTLYLFHYPLLNIVNLYVLPGPLSPYSICVYLGAVALCFGGAVVMYWLFERNTEAVRRWAKRLKIIVPAFRTDRGEPHMRHHRSEGQH